MRPFILFLSTLLLAHCIGKKVILTEKEFANTYLEALKKKHPAISFTLNPDLTITSKKDGQDFNHYIDNAYLAYKAVPDSLEDVIKTYVDVTEDLYIESKITSVVNIIPVIKPVAFLDEINSLNEDKNDALPFITQEYNKQLIIAYAEDTENSLKYLTPDEFKGMNISIDSLHRIAMQNFLRILPDIERRGENGQYMIMAGGYLEASLLALPSLWTTENFPVDGDWIAAIPTRDLLLVTGSNNKQAIKEIKETAAEAYKTGSYPVSEHLFKWNKKEKKFERYE